MSKKDEAAKKIKDFILLNALYGVLDGCTIAYSSVVKMASYVVAETPSMAKEVRFDALSDPIGIALIVADSVIITGISLLANTANKYDPNDNKLRQFQSILALIWPYLRIGLKVLKNNQKAIVNIAKIINITTSTSSQLLNSLITPVGLIFGVIGIINNIYYYRMCERRKKDLASNEDLLAKIKQDESVSLDPRDIIKEQSLGARGLGLISAGFQGFTDGLYYQVGMLMFASFVPGALIGMTAVIGCVIAMSVISSIYKEYEEQRKLKISASKCRVALAENAVKSIEAELAKAKSRALEEVDAELQTIRTKIQRLKAMRAQAKDIQSTQFKRLQSLENKAERPLKDSVLCDALERSLEQLEREQDELLKKREQIQSGELVIDQTLEARLNTAQTNLSQEKARLDKLEKPSMALAMLSGIAGGMMVFAMLGAILYGVSAILTIFSVTFPPALVFTAVVTGFAFTSAYVAYKLYRCRGEQKAHQQKIDEREGVKVLAEGEKAVNKEAPTSWVKSAEKHLFDAFSIIQGACAGVGKGKNLVDFTLNALEGADQTGAEAIIVGVCSLVLGGIYAACLGLRAFGKTAPKNKKVTAEQADTTKAEVPEITEPKKVTFKIEGSCKTSTTLLEAGRKNVISTLSDGASSDVDERDLDLSFDEVSEPSVKVTHPPESPKQKTPHTAPLSRRKNSQQDPGGERRKSLNPIHTQGMFANRGAFSCRNFAALDADVSPYLNLMPSMITVV